METESLLSAMLAEATYTAMSRHEDRMARLRAQIANREQKAERVAFAEQAFKAARYGPDKDRAELELHRALLAMRG